MKKYCIIVAGGSGRRMKSATPKQFLPLAGRPVLMHTIERFSSFDHDISIILVLPAEHHDLWRQLCAEHSFEVNHRVVAGGEERFHSVKAGLDEVAGELALTEENRAPAGGERTEEIPADPVTGVLAGRSGVTAAGNDAAGQGTAVSQAAGNDAAGNDAAGQGTAGNEAASSSEDVLIGIHDGVRPLVGHDTIWRCYSDAEEFGNAVPFIEPADSVRVFTGDDSKPVPRNQVRLIQTPQVFRGSVIIRAYGRDYDPSYTDDATVAEADGVKIHLTHGNRENLKITTPEDLVVATTLAGMLRL